MVSDIITSVGLSIHTGHLLTTFRGADQRVKNCNQRIKNAWPKAKRAVFTTQIVAGI